jgi:glycosyltransferase involved in cell wall biosynthesis
MGQEPIMMTSSAPPPPVAGDSAATRADAPVEPIRVVSIPPPFAEDPYIELFFEALARHGVLLEPPARYGIGWLVRRRARVHAFHVHWLHLFYDEASRLRAWWRFAVFVARVAALRVLGFRLLWTIHNLESHERKHPLLDRLSAALMARLATCLFAHGARGARAASARVGRPVVELPPFAYVGHYPDDVSRAEARSRLGLEPLPAGGLTLVALGKVRAYKGLDRLVDQFRRRARAADRLVIAGRPETPRIESDLRERAGGDPRIRLHLRFVPVGEVQVFLRAADLSVCPYREALTSGMVGLALTFGVPMVAPDLGSIADSVTPDVGFLYDAPDRADALWEAVEAARAADLPRMAAAARDRGREMSWDPIARTAAAAIRAACRP